MRIIDADKLKRKCQKVATEAWKMKIKASAETIMNQFIDFIDETDTVDAVPREIEQANKQATYVRGYEDGQKDKYGRWVDAVLVRHGRWNCSDDVYETAVCSVCGWDTVEPWVHIKEWFEFCPNCGARMDGKGNGNETD